MRLAREFLGEMVVSYTTTKTELARAGQNTHASADGRGPRERQSTKQEWRDVRDDGTPREAL